MSPPKLPLAVVFGLPALVFVLLAWKLNFLCDDAFISFRYTRNLVEGHGLRYNLGSQPPVEGYSNLLWVLALGPFSAAGLDLGIVSRALSLLAGLALCLWVTAHARRRFELDELGTLATGLFFASLPCTALWASGGLATMPAALLAFGVYERLLGNSERPRGLAAAACGAGAVLIRADGFLWVGLILTGGFVSWVTGQRERRLAREALHCALIVALVSGAHFLWRHSYYGEWLPNTARVKAGFSSFRLARGWNYLAQWWLTMPSIALVLALSLRRVRPQWRSSLAVCLTVAMGAQAYALWIGGDFMPFGRLIFSAVPFIALLFGALWAGLESSCSGRKPLARGLAGVLVLSNLLACFDINFVPAQLRSHFHFRLSNEWQSELAMRRSMAQHTKDWTQLGRALALFSEPSDSIVLSAIGAAGYYSRLLVHDRFGLVSPEILEHSQPLPSASPGHDRAVPNHFFFPQHPTFAGAFLAPALAPASYGLPPAWEQSSLNRILRLERHALGPNAGFPADFELRILVHKSWPEVTTTKQSP